MALTTEFRLRQKEIELKSLFETIKAINANVSEEDLFKIFKFFARSNNKITRFTVALKKKDRWVVKASFGSNLEEDQQIEIPNEVLENEKVSFLTSKVGIMREFSRVIPAKLGEKLMAFVFLDSKGLEDEEELDLSFIEAFFQILIVAVENKRLEKEKEKQKEYKRQLEIASKVQTLLFPKSLPYRDRVYVEASYLPHHSIGGDYYDVLKLDDDKLLFCIADVSGKGIPAALLMSNFQAGIRTLFSYTHDLRENLTRINKLILENAGGENFITAFLAIYNFSNNSFSYVNAGHNPPFLFSNGEFIKLKTGTTIIGAFDELPLLEIGQIDSLKKFFLFSYTDGVIETINEEDDIFGFDNLVNFLRDNTDQDQKVLHKKLLTLLNEFKGKNDFDDDLTILSCQIDNS